MMLGGGLGTAGAEVVIEAFLEGEEASFFALCDGTTALPFGTAQDHKRVFDGDEGPNTGGMGAYSPAAGADARPAGAGHARDHRADACGHAGAGHALYGHSLCGADAHRGGPQLIEYNARFGDPETQVLLPRLKSDLVTALLAACDGVLNSISLQWSDDAALTVVMAAKGYPGAVEKGSEIRGIAEAEALDDVHRLPCRHEAGRRPDPRQWRSGAQRHGDRPHDHRGSDGAPMRRCRQSTGPRASAAAISAGAR